MCGCGIRVILHVVKLEFIVFRTLCLCNVSNDICIFLIQMRIDVPETSEYENILLEEKLVTFQN